MSDIDLNSTELTLSQEPDIMTSIIIESTSVEATEPLAQFQYPVKEPFSPNSVHKWQAAHDQPTISPENQNEHTKNELVRTEVLNTCAILLTKLETVRLSVLHLQYSIHAGAITNVQPETTRIGSIWEWGHQTTPLIDMFPEELKLSDQALSELDIFGVADTCPALKTHLDELLDTPVNTKPNGASNSDSCSNTDSTHQATAGCV